MIRIAVIDHDTHTLFVEDIPDDVLKKYNSEEEQYIQEVYALRNYSWDYITEAEYYKTPEDSPIEIDFDNL